MVALSTLLSVVLAGAGALAAPAADADQSVALEKRQSTPNSQGTHDGFFYSWWSDGASPATYTNLAGGKYRIEWQSGGNLVGGKGWNPGLTERYEVSSTHKYHDRFTPANKLVGVFSIPAPITPMVTAT